MCIAGIVSGCFRFPYGNLSLEVVGADKRPLIEYNDYARVADGWGCLYKISFESSKLVKSGLN